MTIKAQREPNLTCKHHGFSFQVEAVNELKDLGFGAVFHEQGLGKTKIGVDLALYWLSTGVADSVLIVTKKALIQNWRDELAIHSHVEPRVLNQDRRANFYSFNSPARIYLAHYEVLKSEFKRLVLFQKTRKVAVILDEAHKIKNPDSSVAKVLFNLAPGFVRRIIMTGTPIANRPYDVWSQIYFLDHGEALGTDFASFKKRLDLSNDLASDSEKAATFASDLATVFGKIHAFSVRETKATADIQLPTKRLQNISVELEWRQRAIYDRFKTECRAIVVKSGIPKLDDADEILKRLLRLVQVASNPRLIDDSYHAVPGKFPVLVELITDIVAAGEKVIVWTAFTDNVDWLARELREFNAVRVHGKLGYDQRNKSIKTFKTDAGCSILVATPPAAKEGLTLTVANHAIFFDRSFSLDDYLQAQDRIHRISQQKACVVSNLIAADTVDEWVDVLLAAKHMAAKLGQGDISKQEYEDQVSYVFGDMIKEILGLDGGENGR
jgi:SNF2 family DNA or RNA helicase